VHTISVPAWFFASPRKRSDTAAEQPLSLSVGERKEARMGNFATMIVVLGGTFFIAGTLLYYSLLPGNPRTGSSKRRAAIETTAIVAATNDRDSAHSAD
jgi:hypothetical protein